MRSVVAFIALSLTYAGAAAPQSTEVSRARAVEVLGTATLLSHESVLLGLSCRSGPVGTLPSLRRVQIGDQISLGTYSFRVGIIEVTKYKQDIKATGAKAGDVECVLAADAQRLPYHDKCDALWVRVTNCRPLP